MPELPEVETIRGQLAPLVEGRTLARLTIIDQRWSRPRAPQELADALEGRRIESLGRRGKYLIWSFSDELYLVQHLRMTAAILCEPRIEPPNVRVRIEFEPKRSLVIVDPRRFGTGELIASSAALEQFFDGRLGVEPFDERFTGEHLRRLARGRSGPIKGFLLDQRQVAGIGNIYADEALFRAQIHPRRAAGRLTASQYSQLRDAVVQALGAGIDARGASIDDFRHVDGVRGAFQDQFLVHRRAGEPCDRCGATIVKMLVAGRGTYVCESCQPRPRRARRASASRAGARRSGG